MRLGGLLFRAPHGQPAPSREVRSFIILARWALVAKMLMGVGAPGANSCGEADFGGPEQVSRANVRSFRNLCAGALDHGGPVTVHQRRIETSLLCQPRAWRGWVPPASGVLTDVALVLLEEGAWNRAVEVRGPAGRRSVRFGGLRRIARIYSEAVAAAAPQARVLLVMARARPSAGVAPSGLLGSPGERACRPPRARRPSRA